MIQGNSIKGLELIKSAERQMSSMASIDLQRETTKTTDAETTKPAVDMPEGMNGPGPLDGNRFSSTRQRFG